MWVKVCTLLLLGSLCQPAWSDRRQPLLMDSSDLVVASYQLSQSIVQSRWRDVQSEDLINLPCKQAKNKGFVQKIGTGSQSPTIGLSIGESEMFVFSRLPIYIGCQVHISHKWRFIYIRQPKSSSTAVLYAIKRHLCGLTDGVGECLHDELHHVTSSDELDDAVWQDYFVFTFVRNPWTRMLSAYKMFSKHFLRRRTGENGDEPGAVCGPEFLTFSENSNSMRELCTTEQCCTYIKRLERWVPYFVDEHISDQSHCVFLPGGESMVDFIGTTETIDADWPQVVEEINRRSGSQFDPGYVNNPNGHGSVKTGGVENVCTSPTVTNYFNTTTLYNIASQYSMDIIRYGYM